MRCTRVGWFVAFGFLVAACGSDSASTATTTAPVAATATTATAVPSTASVTPFVLCYGRADEDPTLRAPNYGYYFGYENSGTTPVVIDEGAANSSDGGDGEDELLVPTVFAPGRVSAAFLAVTDIEFHPSWTIVGPDGETRTAQATGTEPMCAPELFSPPDTRSVHVEYTFTGLPAGSATFEQIEIAATLVGLPPTSVCAPGLEAEPVEVSLAHGDEGEGQDETFTEGTSTVVTVPIASEADGSRTAGMYLRARVVDRCSFDGVVSRGWPVSPDLVGLVNGEGLCLTVDGTAIEQVDCPELPATGGARIRR